MSFGLQPVRNVPPRWRISTYHLSVVRFPGSQPVSFTKADIQKLESRECVFPVRHERTLMHRRYWVCEKSDGVRVLMLVIRVEDTHEVFLVGLFRCVVLN